MCPPIVFSSRRIAAGKSRGFTQQLGRFSHLQKPTLGLGTNPTVPACDIVRLRTLVLPPIVTLFKVHSLVGDENCRDSGLVWCCAVFGRVSVAGSVRNGRLACCLQYLQ